MKRFVVVALLILSVQACRVIQVVPEGGSILSDSGQMDCHAGQQCVIDVENGSVFTQTFTAVAAPGYIFTGWVEADSYMCGGSTTSCALIDIPGQFTDRDIDLYLEPVFELAGSSGDVTAAFTATADYEISPWTVTSDASSSYDPGGNIVDYFWDFGDGTQSSGLVVSHQYNATGTYNQQLTVSTDNGTTHTTSHSVYVAAGNDPFFAEQWHLENYGQAGNGSSGTPGEDVNVLPVWDSCGVLDTCRGEGVVVSIVDDGLDIHHEDLAGNIVPGSYNYSDGSNDPTPRPDQSENAHGTAVAGIIAAVGLNDVGVSGIAPKAQLVGFNLLAGNDTDAEEADAMTREPSDVSNNSWGPSDNLGVYSSEPAAWVDAVNYGLDNGRGGRGRIYLFAAGNGGAPDYDEDERMDWSGKDGQASYPGVIAVGALTDQGKVSSYSEGGANVLVTAPGGEDCTTHTIATTDLTGDMGYNPPVEGDIADTNYTRCFNGTSAATPMVAGVVALMLQANPFLGWRDVKGILASTARKVDPGHADWATNGAGMPINHYYGFGAVDAAAAVSSAENWNNWPEMQASSHPRVVNREIPDEDDTGIFETIDVSGSVNYLEHVRVHIVSDHPFVGDVQVVLTNMDTGTVSVLAINPDGSSADDTVGLNYIFTSVRHMGENANATWRVQVSDTAGGDVGIWNSMELILIGH